MNYASKFAYSFLKLFLVWFVCSGFSSPFFIFGGLGFTLITVYLRYSILKAPHVKVPYPWALIRYFFWLSKEMLKSSLNVAFLIWNPKIKISPRFVRLKASSRKGKMALLSNSIILTPGTVTAKLDQSEKTLVVHVLTQNCADGLADMCKKVESR